MADNGYNGFPTPTMPLSAEQAQRAFQNTQDQSIKSLVGATQIKQKDGKSYWLGMEVAPEMANTLSLVTSLLPKYLNEFLRDGVYEHTKNLTDRLDKGLELKLAEGAARKAGLAAALTVSSLVIAAQPLIQVGVSVRDRAKNRAEIRKALADIIETNKNDYENNEVIKTAMERTTDTMYTGIKHAAAELPTVILNGFYMLQGHKELKNTVNNKAVISASSNNVDTAKRLMEAEAAERNERAAFIKEHGEEAGKHYDEALRVKKSDERHLKRNSSEQNNKPTNKNELQELLPLLATGVGSSLIKTTIAKSDANEKNKHCAYELIMDLQAKSASGHISKGSNISKQVLEIFQANEVDRGRPNFGPVLVEKLEPLAKRIAEVIANNELEPLSLVNFVGEGKVSKKRHFISPEELDEVINEQRKIFGSHEKTKLDEFLADFQSPKLILAAITENLKTLDGNEKALFATLFSDDVLLAAGVQKEEILPLRTAGHDFMYGFVIEKTKELAQKSPEELKEQGLSVKQIESITSLNELISAGKDKEVNDKINGGNIVVAAVRNETLLAQLKGGDAKKLWAERVVKVVKQKPADVVREHDKEAANDEEYSAIAREKSRKSHTQSNQEGVAL